MDQLPNPAMKEARRTAGSRRYRPFAFPPWTYLAEGGLTARFAGRGSINLYHGMRFLLECAVRGDGL